jgi:hypothetical protein
MYPLAFLAVAAFVVFGGERWVLTGPTPLLAGLAVADRVNLYNQLIVVSAALLGFILTAITILVSLDAARVIVQELRLGEGFKLLVANMLATVLLLLILTIMGIAGSVVDHAGAATTFEAFYEWLVLGTLLELVLAGYYFGLVTYKVAAYE